MSEEKQVSTREIYQIVLIMMSVCTPSKPEMSSMFQMGQNSLRIGLLGIRVLVPCTVGSAAVTH